MRYLPSRSDSTEKGTHHIVKRPDQASKGHHTPHPTRGTNLNPATTRSHVEVVRGVAPRSGRPTMATGPSHNTRYNVYPCTPTYTSQHPPPVGALLNCFLAFSEGNPRLARFLYDKVGDRLFESKQDSFLDTILVDRLKDTITLLKKETVPQGVGISPSPLFNLRHPPRHPTPTTT